MHAQVNDYQIRLRGMTRRMMATVSELSMYQAHGIKLSADKESLEGVVMAASDKLKVTFAAVVCSLPFRSRFPKTCASSLT